MNFAVFNVSTGLPARKGNCGADTLADQARDGEVAVEWPEERGNLRDWRLVAGSIEKKEQVL